jgi:tRNA (guanine-N7-)-methyltransferase
LTVALAQSNKPDSNTARPCSTSPMTDRPHQEDLRSYGRRRARAPSARQQVLWQERLPLVAMPDDAQHLADLPALFVSAAAGSARPPHAPRVREVWLEIGFGGGEHLVWQAKAHPDVGIIGCEPFEDGVIKLLDAVEREALTNVKVCAGDARPLLRALPPGSLQRVFILFPDPWPKKPHHKRRIVSSTTLGEVARLLRPGGELRIGTDVAEYAAAILAVAGHSPALHWTARSPQDWRQRPPDWPQTRYEAKAIAAGRRCYFFRFERL